MSDVSELISGHLFGVLEPEQVRELSDWIKADASHARRFARETLIQCHVRQQILGASSLLLEEASEWASPAEDPINEEFDPTLILQAVEQEQRASTARAREQRPQPSASLTSLPMRRVASDTAGPRHVVVPRAVVYVAAAAMAAVLFVVLQAWMGDRPTTTSTPSTAAPVAHLTEAVNCVWADPQLPTQSGAALPAGHLNLVQGFARLTFNSGAQVLLHAPCTFEIKNDMRGYLHGGRLTANVPRRARGFAIETRSVHVIDLGTEFGVHIEPATGELEVHVFVGEVEAHMIDSEGAPHRTQRLKSNQAARFDTPNNRITSIAVDEQLFVRAAPVASPYALEVISDRPLAYWPLNESAGAAIVEDRSGNNFHGHVGQGVALGAAEGILPDEAASVFDGTGSVTVGEFPQFAFTSNFSIEAWVKVSDLEARGGWLISAYKGEGVNHGWGLGYNCLSRFNPRDFHPGIRVGLFDVMDYDFQEATALLQRDRWHHWVFTIDDQYVGRFYLDGQHVQTITGLQPAVADGGHLMIGGIHGTYSRFHGAVAHVAVYNRVLGEDRIERHYQAAIRPEGRTQPADGE